jgi:TRAP-type C4-dicarboxylate transport system substrate-binding protein
MAIHFRVWIGLALGCAALWNGAQAQSSVPVQTLRIVGGLSGLHQYSRNEEPFWTKDLARLSGGKYNAEIVPFDRAGVPGPEMLRLMQYGVVPFGTALLSNISNQTPELAAPDLAGLNPDLPTLRKNLTAFRPYLEKTLRERHSVELLAVYLYPAQVLFCKKPFKNLSEITGRRVRVSSATQSDFVTALGATPVLIGLQQIAASMVSGNVECAITGSMTGNTLGLFEQSNYLYTLPITWGLAIFAANGAAWQALPGDLRALIAREVPKLETAIWSESERETADGIACNQGLPSCQAGRKGAMTMVTTTAQDQTLRQELLRSSILPRWLQRCGAGCNALWNQTIGISSGMLLPSSP